MNPCAASWLVIHRGRLAWPAAGAAALSFALAGCSGRPAAPRLPAVDAGEAAELAIERYDANDDGALDTAEFGQCPPLATARAQYDADGDGRLSAEEMEDRINGAYGSGAALATVECTVTWNGRPLDGASVKFRPVEMLESSLKSGEGVANESGAARLSMDDADLPDDLKGAPLMQPGLYHVEITHPKVALPSSYNTETKLGFEVDPARRGGTSARFDLRAK